MNKEFKKYQHIERFGTTVLQKVIQWTIENAENIESTSGNNYIAIDHEEMRKNFDMWLEEEKQQIKDAVKYGFNYATCANNRLK